MADLTLGTTPGSLELLYVLGDPQTYALLLEDADGEPLTWPAAPVLEFYGTVLSFASTLSSHESGVDNLATWNLSEEQIAQMHALTEKKPRLAVDGITWYFGTVKKIA